MKSADWAKWFNNEAKGNFEFLVQRFAEETQDLVAQRTKNSGVFKVGDKEVDSRQGATAGALREQRSKWVSLCNKVDTLKDKAKAFDEQVTTAKPPIAKVPDKKYNEKVGRTLV